MAVAYFLADYKEYNQDTGQVISTTPVYVSYDPDVKTCDQAFAPFGGNLTKSQAEALRATCATVAPSIPNGSTVIVRDCSSNPTDPGTTSDDEPAINTDLSGETDVTYYDAQ